MEFVTWLILIGARHRYNAAQRQTSKSAPNVQISAKRLNQRQTFKSAPNVGTKQQLISYLAWTYKWRVT